MKIIYAGPSIAKMSQIKKLCQDNNVKLKSPIKAGQIWNDLSKYKYISEILIIDGYFHSTLAVLHAEILNAISYGITVYGSASLGALRAVELKPQGMKGIGRIYDYYLNNPETGDDEVAVIHSPQEPYEPYSVPLINLRILHHKLKDSKYKLLLEKLLKELETIGFSKRNWNQIKQLCKIISKHDSTNSLFFQIKADYIDYKQRDALSSIRMLLNSKHTKNKKHENEYRDSALSSIYIYGSIGNSEESEENKTYTIDQLTALLRLSGQFSPSSFAIEHFKDLIYSTYKKTFEISEQEIEDEINRINNQINELFDKQLDITVPPYMASSEWARKNLVFEKYIYEKIDENEIYFVNHLLFRSLGDKHIAETPKLNRERLHSMITTYDTLFETSDDIDNNNKLFYFCRLNNLRINQFWQKAVITRFNDFKILIKSMMISLKD